MNFYFEAAKTLDRLDAKEGSIKGVLATLPEKDRRRTAALVIETLKCKGSFLTYQFLIIYRSYKDKSVLTDVMNAAKLMAEERKTITSLNLALVLVHDQLFAGGIQAGDGPMKRAIMRHKTRLHGELQKIKIKRGTASNSDLARDGDHRAGSFMSNFLRS
jgi:putative methyltransferase